jgi:tRNA-dihydrouridine synthase B
VENLLHPVSIGNLKLSSNVFLAPLAGYTDKIFRSICLKHGAALAYTEMVSSEGVARGSEKTIMLMERGENEEHLAVQLFMPDADTAKRSLEGTMAYNPSMIDINAGCPVPKVIKTGAGSSLLRNPQTIYKIVKTITANVSVPVTIKIRTGWDVESINYLETAQAAFDGGASALCMHARTRSQLYMPTANWALLKDLKSHFPEKVIIGSGDLFTAQDGLRMLEETGIDAIMFARGAIGNPFVFEQIQDLAQGKEPREIPVEEKRKAIEVHLEGLVSFLGENAACREMRKHVCAYLKGIPNSAKVRQLATTALTVDDYKKTLDHLCN